LPINFQAEAQTAPIARPFRGLAIFLAGLFLEIIYHYTSADSGGLIKRAAQKGRRAQPIFQYRRCDGDNYV